LKPRSNSSGRSAKAGATWTIPEDFVQLLGAFENASVRYLHIGAYAVSLLSTPRSAACRSISDELQHAQRQLPLLTRDPHFAACALECVS
jgi:hypothetical protein